MTLSNNQKSFIDFLVNSSALTFGDFVTKSGRKTPYFINTGKFDDGDKISKLGAFYAAHIHEKKLSKANIIFGPAYKGIPLCVTTAAALSINHKLNVGFSFNRKEAKTHGDGGTIVGKKISDGDQIILVEDVITAGTTMREVVPMLNTIAKVNILGVVIAVDRCERGSSNLSAVAEVQENMKLPVYPIVTIHDIVAYLSTPNSSGFTISPEIGSRIQAYIKEYGA